RSGRLELNDPAACQRRSYTTTTEADVKETQSSATRCQYDAREQLRPVTDRGSPRIRKGRPLASLESIPQRFDSLDHALTHNEWPGQCDSIWFCRGERLLTSKTDPTATLPSTNTKAWDH
ncbi:MAG TPA: hypothetical protein VJX67_13715, partial [Blastocatellia bacterium]|nr:hypothetical protein [Blastocatellia bacterium]